MEVTQFTYFQQVGGIDCRPVSAEITYGLERLAMYVQGVDNGFDLAYNTMNRQSPDFMTLGRRLSSKRSRTIRLQFRTRRRPKRCSSTSRTPKPKAKSSSRAKSAAAPPIPNWRHVLPAYEQCIRASHTFNLLDARGVISVTERQAYIGRVRALAKECAQAWIESPQGMTLGAGMSGMATLKMPQLLLELFSEEIPARMQATAARDLERLVVGALTDRGFLNEGARGFATPRRLALVIEGLPADPIRRQRRTQRPKGRRARRTRSKASCARPA